MGTLLVEMNEVNFDVVKGYLENGYNLPNFEKLLSLQVATTSSEKTYENIEPWIQWVSVYTGLTFSEHKIFHLGDAVKSDNEQIFERIEAKGYRVGALCPMNARNALENPCFFVPDPWTDTTPDGSPVSILLTDALKQIVNDNAQDRITLLSGLKLITALLLSLRPFALFRLAIRIPKALSEKWRKAIFLDELLFEIFLSQNRRKKPDFSVIFLNAGAHMQHHYFHSCAVLKTNALENPEWYVKRDQDPLIEVLSSYDKILGHLFARKDQKFIVCTGMSQTAYAEATFYYRLKDHEKFFANNKMPFAAIKPRMTRDFEVSFADRKQQVDFCKKLQMFKIEGRPIFEVVSMGDDDCFVTLNHPFEITKSTKLDTPMGVATNLDDLFAFVAIKNGHHIDKGWVVRSNALPPFNFSTGSHVCNVFNYIDSLFPSKGGIEEI